MDIQLKEAQARIKELEAYKAGARVDQKENISVAFSECERANKAETKIKELEAELIQRYKTVGELRTRIAELAAKLLTINHMSAL